MGRIDIYKNFSIFSGLFFIRSRYLAILSTIIYCIFLFSFLADDWRICYIHLCESYFYYEKIMLSTSSIRFREFMNFYEILQILKLMH